MKTTGRTFTKMSAKDFLVNLPTLLEKGYKGEPYTLCLSDGFLKSIRREMRTGDYPVTSIFIFCGEYFINPFQVDSALYLNDCDDYYEVFMYQENGNVFNSFGGDKLFFSET